ncbi:MAG: hypothetical protein AAF216_04630 [Pseudomonadota bacterium]
MKHTADNLISDLASTVAFYETARKVDGDLNELHQVAESALAMLVVIRQHQLERQGEGGADSLNS